MNDLIGWIIAVLFIVVLFIIFIMSMMMAAKEGDKHMDEIKEARWKGAGMGDYYCSLCGEIVSGNHLSECPNCKAKMKEGCD